MKRTLAGALYTLILGLGLIGPFASRTEAQKDLSLCRGMLVYPNIIFPQYIDGILISFGTNDRPEQVREWYARSLRGWRFQDFSRTYPTSWRFANPAAQQTVVIYLSRPTGVQFQC